MKTPHFGMNPDHCKAGNFEVGCQRWNIPTYCIQYCTDCCGKEIWWKNWNTRYDFPFRQNAAKFGESIETPDTVFPSDRMLQNLLKELKHQIQFSLQTECCTGKFSPSMLELWASAGQLRKREITEHYTVLNTTLSPLQSLNIKTGSCLWCITVITGLLTSFLRFE